MSDQAAAIIADAIKTLAWCIFWGLAFSGGTRIVTK